MYLFISVYLFILKIIIYLEKTSMHLGTGEREKENPK